MKPIIVLLLQLIIFSPSLIFAETWESSLFLRDAVYNDSHIDRYPVIASNYPYGNDYVAAWAEQSECCFNQYDTRSVFSAFSSNDMITSHVVSTPYSENSAPQAIAYVGSGNWLAAYNGYDSLGGSDIFVRTSNSPLGDKSKAKNVLMHQ